MNTPQVKKSSLELWDEFDEKGQIDVMRPLNATHYSVYITITFDGTQKSGFNYYVESQLSKTRGLFCR